MSLRVTLDPKAPEISGPAGHGCRRKGWTPPGSGPRRWAARPVERSVGENPYHDVAVRRDMPWEDWLSALWLGRVMVVDLKSMCLKKDPPPVQVAQAMVRKDVWDYLLDFGRQALSGGDRFTGEGVTLLSDSPVEQAALDLKTVSFAMHELRMTWFEGTTTGPQHGEWENHRRFHQALVEIADREIARYEE